MNLARNIAAVLIGLIVGSFVNLGLITVGPMIIPPPVGVDVLDMFSIRENLNLFEAKHFIFPFLAHSLGTLVGAGVAYAIAGSRRLLMAMVIGIAFFCGGVYASTIIPAPTWFIVLDLVFAYIPAAWLGAKLTSAAFVKGTS